MGRIDGQSEGAKDGKFVKPSQNFLSVTEQQPHSSSILYTLPVGSSHTVLNMSTPPPPPPPLLSFRTQSARASGSLLLQANVTGQDKVFVLFVCVSVGSMDGLVEGATVMLGNSDGFELGNTVSEGIVVGRTEGTLVCVGTMDGKKLGLFVTEILDVGLSDRLKLLGKLDGALLGIEKLDGS